MLQNQNVPDIATNIESAAVFIAENGVEFEKEIMDSFPGFSFLMSSDPNHGIYQKKLMEYKSGAHKDDSDISSTTKIIQPPPGSIKTLIERTALFVAKGLKAEEMMMECNVYNPSYNFMRRSDPFHAFYKQKLNEYRSQVGDDDATDSEVDDAAEQPRTQPQFIDLPDFLLFFNPPGMSLKEFDTIKLTAHFVSWYGAAFWLGLAKRKIPELEFMDSTDSRFKCFSEFVVAYSKVLTPPAGLKQELRNSAAYTATIIDAFLQRLKWDPVQHYEWLQGGVKAMLDWHASVTKDFTNKDQNPQMLQSPPSLEEPDPKRQKLDESALVPEDQFLAQHPGSSTIKVSVQDAAGGAQVIEIIVQSLSERVASLKEKIAGKIQIPANTQNLSGKAGVLKDNNRSLAHYNVGAGDILTLSL